MGVVFRLGASLIVFGLLGCKADLGNRGDFYRPPPTPQAGAGSSPSTAGMPEASTGGGGSVGGGVMIGESGRASAGSAGTDVPLPMAGTEAPRTSTSR
jgi:hypothetical protein